MNVAICDSQPGEAAATSALIQAYRLRHPDVSVTFTVFSGGRALLDAFQRGIGAFDLYLLETLLKGPDGIQTAHALRAMGERRRIVFLTSDPSRALDAFSVNAAGYLLKPLEQAAFFAMLDDCAEDSALRRANRRQHFSFRTPSGFRTVALNDIISVEVLGHVPIFHTVNGPVRGSEMRVSMEDGMPGLLHTGCFLRPHRSHLVNASHVASLSPRQFEMDDGSIVPVARQRIAEVKSAYSAYLAHFSDLSQT